MAWNLADRWLCLGQPSYALNLALMKQALTDTVGDAIISRPVKDLRYILYSLTCRFPSRGEKCGSYIVRLDQTLIVAGLPAQQAKVSLFLLEIPSSWVRYTWILQSVDFHCPSTLAQARTIRQ
jgi:hypothetical protein